MKDLVSVIVPTFNRIAFLTTAINSVENQTYSNWELLIVDDFSTDSTENVVKEISQENPKIRYLKNPIKGANNARNFGLSKAKGKWVVFLDSDDELSTNMIDSHLSVLESKSSVQLSVSYSKIYTERDHSVSISDTITSKNLLLDFLTKKVTWPINTAMIKKEFLEFNAIIFDPKLLNGQDYCFFLSILFHEPSIEFIPKILSINHHRYMEPKEVKVSAGKTLKHKLSRLRSRNIALGIAIKKLSLADFSQFLKYYLKYQVGLIFFILK